jgi:hypothetical protein
LYAIHVTEADLLKTHNQCNARSAMEPVK